MSSNKITSKAESSKKDEFKFTLSIEEINKIEEEIKKCDNNLKNELDKSNSNNEDN
ncbi:hypothetical protein [Nitrosopumilus adriaticus]|uniref:Uncharacterized protein n=1 Tax=Nitrosopumilus adriaticus TaxID=1580092 RepID=A0A0D5C1Y6_9ARCH|nr:hypothetical protein [Nitrosopumilus adriaticus]AJW70761.1 hypothetical protein NADRNF5_1071 [Nitrosopumilus adriaticus]